MLVFTGIEVIIKMWGDKMTTKINVKDTLIQSFSLLKKNFFRYVVIVIIIESLIVLVMNEIIENVFNLALLSAKVDGITNDNFMAILKNPLAMLIILLVVLTAVVLIILQITFTYYYASADYKIEKTTFKKPLSALKNINFKHVPILLIYIFLIMPNGNIGVTSGLTSKVHIPRFVIDSLLGNTYFIFFYYGMIAVSFYLNLRLFYTFAIFTNEPLSFFGSMKKSWKMTQKNLVRIIIIAVSISLFSIILILLAYLIHYGLFELFALMLPQHTDALKHFFQSSFVIMSAIILSVSTILTIQITVVSYHQLSHKIIQDDIILSTLPQKRMLRFGLFTLSIISLILLLVITNPLPKFSGNTKVVSHRGESSHAIENTLESLILANSYKPDYVEIDIQQTKDHQIVVFHDYNLRRLTGNTRTERINTLNWDELRSIHLKYNGHTSKIAFFYDYLELAKSLEQHVMIEIKTTLLDSESFVDDVMTMIENLDMTDMVIFQSLDINIMLELKEKYPEAITGYIIGFNLGGLQNYHIDFYSMEISSVTSKIISDIKRYNKSLFIWTINSENDIQSYLQLDVAGIITDNTHYAMKIKNKLNENPFSNILFNLEFKLLKIDPFKKELLP